MALINCSINSASLTKTGGQAIGSDNATLTITPATGYVVNAADFTVSNVSFSSNGNSLTFQHGQNGVVLPTGVTSVTLINTGTGGGVGNTIAVAVDLTNSFVMPSSDTTLIVDIDGSATLQGFTVQGTFEQIGSGLSVANTTTGNWGPVSGQFNSSSTVFTRTISAASGKYFPTAPTCEIAIGDSSRYTISSSDATDSDNNITGRAFTVSYNFPNQNVTGDKIKITGTAIDIPSTTTEITAYSISTNKIPNSGETRLYRVYGTPGATFSVAVVDSNNSSVAGISNITLDSTGTYDYYITFPSISSGSETYTITISGDLSSTFGTSSGQPTSVNIVQQSNVILTLGLTCSDSTVTVPANQSINLPIDEVDFSTSYTNEQYTFYFTVTRTVALYLKTIPTSAFNNQSQTSGINFDVQSITITNNNTTSVTLAVLVNLNSTEDTNLTSTLNLDTYINNVPTGSPFTFNVNQGDPITLNLQSRSSASDPEGDGLAFIISGLPTNGKLFTDANRTDEILSNELPATLSGNTVYYEHDNTNTSSDTFTFKISDGNSTTANITATANVNLNQAPTASGFTFSLLKGASKELNLATLSSPSDPDGDTLSYKITGLPSAGSDASGQLFTDSALQNQITSTPTTLSSSTIYYKHDNSNDLTDSFTFRVSDGSTETSDLTASATIGVAPGAAISTSGNSGIFLIAVTLGTAAGTFKVHCDSFDVFDRFQILFDTNGNSNNIADMEVVADSLYVGDNDFGSNDIPSNGQTTGLSEYTYVGSGGNAPAADFNGSTSAADKWNRTGNANQTITITDDIVSIASAVNRSNFPADTSELAPSRGSNSTTIKQVNVQTGRVESTTSNNYSLITGGALNNGNVCLYYTKSATTNTVAYIKISSHPTEGTGWNILHTSFNANFGTAYVQTNNGCGATAYHTTFLAYPQDNTWANGKIVYLDPEETQVLVGNGNTYKFHTYVNDPDNISSYQGVTATISNTGVISSKFTCTA
jgi:hypothetical protein